MTTRSVEIPSKQPTISIEPVPLLPFSLEPAALLMVLGLFAWTLARVLRRRRRQPKAWPVPSLLGLEAILPEPVSLPKPEPPLQGAEPAPVDANAEVGEETREEELELVA